MSQANPDASSAHAEDRLVRDSFDPSIEVGESRMGNSEFQQKLLGGLIRDCYNIQSDNIYFLRSGMGPTARIKKRLEDRFFLFAMRRGFVRKPPVKEVSKRLRRTLRNIDGLERFYHLLQDGYSRQLLIELLKFRVLGGQHVRLPSNNPEYWAKYNSVDKSFLEERHTFKTSWDYDRYLDRYKLQGDTGALSLHTHPDLFLTAFLLEQYTYRKGKTVEVEPGDTVIDAGGCYGESTLYFADKAAPQGRIYCFEFDPENLKILHENLDLNERLSASVKVVPNALYDKSGESLSYSPNGPMTTLHGEQQRATQVSTLAIDDFVREEGVEKVDFIKMDIEGAELAALRGAEETLRSFRPKLAIALYHKADDFITIPYYLDKLDLGYEFFLDHFTIQLQETVLFASPKAD